MAAFPARYNGRCGSCGEPIREGDPIRFDAESATNFVHDDCGAAETRAPDPLAAEHPVCPKCWLTHPEGACDR